MAAPRSRAFSAGPAPWRGRSVSRKSPAKPADSSAERMRSRSRIARPFPAAGLKRKACLMRRILRPPTMRGAEHRLPGDHVAILKVAKLGSPILRKRASEIEAHDLRKGRFRTFFEDMMETMVEYHGTGLAAPQVSTGLRVGLYQGHGEIGRAAC